MLFREGRCSLIHLLTRNNHDNSILLYDVQSQIYINLGHSQSILSPIVLAKKVDNYCRNLLLLYGFARLLYIPLGLFDL